MKKKGIFIFLFFQFLIFVLNLLITEPVMTLLSFINFLLFLGYFFYFGKNILILLFPFVIQSLLQVSGTFYLELEKIYLFEIEIDSYFKGSVPELISIHMLFYTIIYMLSPFVLKEINERQILKNIKKSQSWIVLLLILLTFSNVMLLIKGIQHPFFLYNFDRFQYMNALFSGIEKKMYMLGFYFAPVLGFSMKLNKKIRIISILNFLVMIFYNFLYGVKYGEYIVIIYFFIFSVVITNLNGVKRYFRYISLFLIVALIGISFHRILLYGGKSGNFYSYFGNRAAQQGQLWWAMFNRRNEGNTLEFLNEISKNHEDNKEIYPLGIYKIMHKNMSEELYHRRLRSGSRLSSSTMASMNYYFGIMGNYMFYGILAILLSLYIKYIIRQYNKAFIFFPLSLFLGYRVYIYLTRLNTMSAFDNLFYNTKLSLSCFLFIIYSLFIECLLFIKRNKKNF